MILVSIIVPVYNTEEYLDRCLDSIQNQTLKEIEIIVVNDGSTDSSLEIIKKHMNEDNRIVLIDQENGGQSAARNSGIKIAKGQYIGFVDSDDYIEKNMYESLYNMCKKNETDIAICNLYKINGESKEIWNKRIKDEFIDIDKYGIENYIMDYIRSYRHSNEVYIRLFKSELIKNNNIYFDINSDKDMKEIGEDMIYNIKTIIYAKSIISTNKPYYYYIVREGSAMTSEKKQLFLRYINMIKKLNAFLCERINNKELVDRLTSMLLISICKEVYYFYKNVNKIEEYRQEWNSIKKELFIKRYMFNGKIKLNLKQRILSNLLRYNLFKVLDLIEK